MAGWDTQKDSNAATNAGEKVRCAPRNGGKTSCSSDGSLSRAHKAGGGPFGPPRYIPGTQIYGILGFKNPHQLISLRLSFPYTSFTSEFIVNHIEVIL